MEETLIDLSDLEAEYFLRHEQVQGKVDALREIARVLSLYNTGKVSFTNLQLYMARIYSVTKARAGDLQSDSALAVYSEFLARLDEKGR